MAFAGDARSALVDLPGVGAPVALGALPPESKSLLREAIEAFSRSERSSLPRDSHSIEAGVERLSARYEGGSLQQREHLTRTIEQWRAATDEDRWKSANPAARLATLRKGLSTSQSSAPVLGLASYASLAFADPESSSFVPFEL